MGNLNTRGPDSDLQVQWNQYRFRELTLFWTAVIGYDSTMRLIAQRSCGRE
jgi:hypothetical protein